MLVVERATSYWAMKYGAGSGVAFDLDERSLAAARHNLASSHDIEIRYGSAYEISYEDEFDIEFSIGVIHHLDEPGRAIFEVMKSVKPGGTVLVSLYGYKKIYRTLRKYSEPD